MQAVYTYEDTSLGSLLYMDSVSLQQLAHHYGTPLYVYSLRHILQRLRLFQQAVSSMRGHIHFAVKANSHQAILTQLANHNCGMDVVSMGELHRALKAGVPARKILFSGVAKSDAEISEALKEKILQINVESIEELYQINAIAKRMQCIAPIALRVNPDIDAQTHAKISTGKKTDKFGINISLCQDIYKKAMWMSNVDPQGIAVHIGSQIMSCYPFAKAYARVADIAVKLQKDGINIKRLDLGGGLGIAYKKSDTPPKIDTYVNMVKHETRHLDLDIHFEPGRWLVGNAGVLLGRVENIKSSDGNTFILTDVGMNDLIRPSLYDAYHHITPVKKTLSHGRASLVGPVCESGDFIGKDRAMPLMRRGDIFAIRSVGAYGMVQASNYNSRPMVAEVLVNHGKSYLIKKRQTIQDIIDNDIVPDMSS